MKFLKRHPFISKLKFNKHRLYPNHKEDQPNELHTISNQFLSGINNITWDPKGTLNNSKEENKREQRFHEDEKDRNVENKQEDDDLFANGPIKVDVEMKDDLFEEDPFAEASNLVQNNQESDEDLFGGDGKSCI